MTPIEGFVDQFEEYVNNPLSGKCRFSDSTNENTIANLKRVLNSYCVFHLEELLKKRSSMELAQKLEDRSIQDSARYQYVLAIKSFLLFLSQDEEISSETHRLIQFALVRWESARKNYQKGLTAHRATAKKREIVAKENDRYPKLSDVASCEIYYRNKLPKISKGSFSKGNLHRFYAWLTFSLSKSNALRPSSIGNMKLDEFQNAFQRPSLRIVCVEGNLYVVYFFHFSLFFFQI